MSDNKNKPVNESFKPKTGSAKPRPASVGGSYKPTSGSSKPDTSQNPTPNKPRE